MLPMADALDRLPRFGVIAVQQKTAVGSQNVAGMGTQKGTQNSVQPGQTVSAAVHGGGASENENRSVNAGESRELSAAVDAGPKGGENWGTRIRT